jgi:hypothetical protein
MADRGGTIEWKLSTHKVFAGVICFPDQLGRRLKCAPTSIHRGVNLRDHGDAECCVDFPRMTLTIAARTAIGL